MRLPSGRLGQEALYDRTGVRSPPPTRGLYTVCKRGASSIVATERLRARADQARMRPKSSQRT